MDKIDIDLIVEGIKAEFDYSNLEDLLDMLDIGFFIVPASNYFLCGQQACLLRSGDQEDIYLSDECPEELAPFVLAHELGHAILHDTEISHFSRRRRTALEQEADYFAVRLLDVHCDLYEIEGYSTEEIARAYGLREDAVKYLIE